MPSSLDVLHPPPREKPLSPACNGRCFNAFLNHLRSPSTAVEACGEAVPRLALMQAVVCQYVLAEKMYLTDGIQGYTMTGEGEKTGSDALLQRRR